MKTKGNNKTQVSKPVTTSSRPPWSLGIDPMPMPYVNPFYPEGDDHRHGWRQVGHLSSAQAVMYLARRKNQMADDAATQEALPARDVILALLRSPQGSAVLWPPWPPDRHDSRRSYLRKLADYHQVTVRFRDAGQGSLLVDLVGEVPRAKKVQVLTAIEAENLAIAYQTSLGASCGTSFLRDEPAGEADDPRDDYEPYVIYLKRLQELHSQDPGAGVVYPYHQRRDERNQQIRLHQEARRWGMAISIKKLDADHALLQVKRISQAARDGRRSYERSHDEMVTASPGRGQVHVLGSGPRRTAPKADATPLSMEDL
jgi:hypothetical protein